MCAPLAVAQVSEYLRIGEVDADHLVPAVAELFGDGVPYPRGRSRDHVDAHLVSLLTSTRRVFTTCST